MCFKAVNDQAPCLKLLVLEERKLPVVVPVSNKQCNRFKEACETKRSTNGLYSLWEEEGTQCCQQQFIAEFVMGCDRRCMIVHRELALGKLETLQQTQASLLKEE